MFENSGLDLIDMYSNKKEDSNHTSVFDSRNGTKDSNNLFGGDSVYAEMNKRESNHGNLSVIDRMRGIQAGRFDLGDEVSLAEQYNDRTLDKRTLGGAYNVTISDIYKDDALFKAHYNLYTDGYIEEQESTQLDLQRDDLLNKNSDILTVSEMTKSNDELYKRNNEAGESFNSGQSHYILDNEGGDEAEKDKTSSTEYHGSLGIYNTQFSPNKDRNGNKSEEVDISKKKQSTEFLNKIKEEEQKDNKTSKEENVKKKKAEKVDHLNQPTKQKDDDYIEFKAYDRVRIDSEAVLKAKELNMDKDNPEKITSKMLRDEFFKPYILQEYSELRKTVNNLEKRFEKSKSEIEKSTIEKEISLIKPILIKKALYDNV